MSEFAGAEPRHLDATSVLTLFLLTGVVPTSLTFTAIGALGRPIILVSLAMFAWWLGHSIQRPFREQTGMQPMRWPVGAFVCVVAASYAAAMLRGLPGTEVSPADTALLRVAAWCGIFLVAHDGLSTWASLTAVLRRVVLTGTLMAMLGLAQFATKNSLLGWFVVPGMSGDGVGIDQRGGFVRAAGTASHPLEYGVVLCVTLPLAVAFGMADRDRGVVRRWFPAVLIGTASVLSVSRSALIAVAVAMLVLAASWTRRQRTIAGIGGVILMAAVYVAVPGMAGTLIGMFMGASQDPSIASRVNGADVAFAMAGRLPLLGRGFGTMLPTYAYLDNQYLGILVELGFVGLCTVIALFVTAIVLAWRGRRLAAAPLSSKLGAGLAAGISSAAVTFTFFDALSFPLSAAFMFLMLGVAGAYWRLVRTQALAPDGLASTTAPTTASFDSGRD
ncbi:O-antigen ligase family protein [Sinomonas flava]|uniref:O-antigen ligase-related domain-containing protein n=1 Tax=Sinomonas flava TaxID=496857 RepID=A0ABP5NLX4_9MICC